MTIMMPLGTSRFKGYSFECCSYDCTTGTRLMIRPSRHEVRARAGMKGKVYEQRVDYMMILVLLYDTIT